MYNLSSASVLCVIYLGWWFHLTDMHTLSALTVIRDGYVGPLHMAVTVSSSRELEVTITYSLVRCTSRCGRSI